MPKKKWLNSALYKKIAQALTTLSINKIRFTGGEPLLRPDLAEIITVFATQFPNATLALTTNGLRFSDTCQELQDAGLSSVTFHLDTLRPERYGSVMGRGSVDRVLHAIDIAKTRGFEAKINCVVQKNVNDDEIISFLKLSKEFGVQVRFIELMNTGSSQDYVEKSFMSGQAILETITATSPVKALKRCTVSDPAEQFYAYDFGVRFGLIASDTRPFCGACDRLRLSADGRLLTCLYQMRGHSLGITHNTWPSEQELIAAINSAVAQKRSFHPALHRSREKFSMSQRGG